MTSNGASFAFVLNVKDAPLSTGIYATQKKALGIVEKPKFLASSTFEIKRKMYAFFIDVQIIFIRLEYVRC